MVEQPGDATHGRDRNEHGNQRQRRCDDGRRDLAHGLDGRLTGLHAALHFLRHGFDNDDGVVDDDANGQHEAKQRQRIDRKAQQREHRECADKRHRYCQGRYERGAGVLQEDVDDEDDQRHCLQQGNDNFPDAGFDRPRRVQRHHVVNVFREVGLESLELGEHRRRDFEAVGIRQLVDHGGR